MRGIGRHLKSFFFDAFLVLLALGLYFTMHFAGDPNPPAYLKDVSGNILVEVFGGFLFLAFALHLGKENDEAIRETKQLVAKREALLDATDAKLTALSATVAKRESALELMGERIATLNAITTERERILDTERAIERFKMFLRHESYHNARIKVEPQSDSLGIEYVIEPVRDDKGEPKANTGEMEHAYVILVREVFGLKYFDDDDKLEYERSPIKEGEYYYARFFNDSWHLSQDGLTEWYAFSLSSKVGPGYIVVTANEFMGHRDAPEGLSLVCELKLDATCNETDGYNGFTPHNILRDNAGGLFLKIHDSPPKALYSRSPHGSHSSDEFYFFIEDLVGHYDKESRERLLQVVERRLSEMKMDVPKLHWWQLDA